MENNRKLAVSFGTFACVIEGYDDPFSIMRKTVLHFERLAEENPGFGNFADIVDYDDLVARLRDEEDAEIDLEPIAGGVYIRKLERPQDAEAAPAAMAAASDFDEPPLEETDVSEEDLADLAALDGAPSQDNADEGMANGIDDDLSDDADDYEAPAEDEADYSPAEAEAPLEEIDAAVDGDISEFEPEIDADADPDVPEDNTGYDADLDDADGLPETSPFQSTSGFGRPLHEPQDDDLAEVDDQDVAEEAAAFTASLDDTDGDATDDFDETPPEDAADDTTDEQLADPAPGAWRLGGDDEPAATPLRLDTAPSSQDDDDSPVPLRLGGAAPQADDSATDETPAPKPLFLRLKPEADDKDAADGSPDEGAPAAKPAGLGALRLGPELKPVPPANADTSGPSFIDTVAANDPPDKAAAKASDAEKAADKDAEAAPKSGGLRLGSLLRRKSTEADGAVSDSASTPEPSQKTSENPAEEAPAEKPKGGLLRVVPSPQERDLESTPPGAAEPTADPAPQAEEAPAARGGFRSFLRGKPKEAPKDSAAAEEPAKTPDPAAPEHTPSPAPSPASSPAPSAAAEPVPEPEVAEKPAAPDQDSSSMRDRLHASFAKSPEPAAKTFDLDEADGEEEAEVTTPRGFAKAAGASALHEVMSAAAGYLSVVEHRATMTRGEIVECTESITGGAPLSAQAKVMAFGKLTRSGDLIRIEGGLFMMSEEAIARYRQTLDGAA